MVISHSLQALRLVLQLLSAARTLPFIFVNVYQVQEPSKTVKSGLRGPSWVSAVLCIA